MPYTRPHFKPREASRWWGDALHPCLAFRFAHREMRFTTFVIFFSFLTLFLFPHTSSSPASPYFSSSSDSLHFFFFFCLFRSLAFLFLQLPYISVLVLLFQLPDTSSLDSPYFFFFLSFSAFFLLELLLLVFQFLFSIMDFFRLLVWSWASPQRIYLTSLSSGSWSFCASSCDFEFSSHPNLMLREYSYFLLHRFLPRRFRLLPSIINFACY